MACFFLSSFGMCHVVPAGRMQVGIVFSFYLQYSFSSSISHTLSMLTYEKRLRVVVELGGSRD